MSIMALPIFDYFIRDIKLVVDVFLLLLLLYARHWGTQGHKRYNWGLIRTPHTKKWGGGGG